jgi:hypothetical protein
MTSRAAPSKRPRWPLIVALTVSPVLLGALLTMALAGPSSSEGDLWVGATDYGPTSDREERHG